MISSSSSKDQQN